MFEAFPNLLLMRDGKSVYFGPTKDAVPYFQSGLCDDIINFSFSFALLLLFFFFKIYMYAYIFFWFQDLGYVCPERRTYPDFLNSICAVAHAPQAGWAGQDEM